MLDLGQHNTTVFHSSQQSAILCSLVYNLYRMLCLKYHHHPPSLIPNRIQSVNISNTRTSVVVCAAKGPRPRYPRVWKTRKRIGTISKSAKLVDCVKGLSNVKEELYGALDSFIAWELEFPLIAVKKALKTLETQGEWKRVIQVTKWMLSKGQGRTMGTYFTLLNALAEDERLGEVEELWTKLFSDNLESMPRTFFDKMISIYYKRDMHDKLFEIFADMEELGVRPSASVVNMMGNVFQKLDMLDKYYKLKRKYPLPKWIYRYIKGKRVRIRAKQFNELDGATDETSVDEEASHDANELDKEDDTNANELDKEADTNANELDKMADINSEKIDMQAIYFNELDGANDEKSADEEAHHDANELDKEADTNANELDKLADINSEKIDTQAIYSS